MNERIRELYEQARLHAKTVNADLDPQGWMDEYHKKFAELIVQECLEICKEKEQANLYGVREVENTIKQHFGVEE